MKFYSEITKSFYDSVESCEEAEKEYNKALDEKKEKEKALKATRKARAEELSDAYKAIKEAEKKYSKLRNQFVNDYGSYHMTFTDSDVDNLFDPFRFFIF